MIALDFSLGLQTIGRGETTPDSLDFEVLSEIPGAECAAQEREAMGIPERLIRYSVGIEDPQDLILEVSQALQNPHLSGSHRAL